MPVITQEVDDACEDRRRRDLPSLSFELPLQGPGAGIDGIEIPVRAANVDDSVRAGRRRNHAPAGMKFPLDRIELRSSMRVVHARVLQVSAKHRCILRRGRPAKSAKKQTYPYSASFHDTLLQQDFLMAGRERSVTARTPLRRALTYPERSGATGNNCLLCVRLRQTSSG
jgi:hypothetical protein